MNKKEAIKNETPNEEKVSHETSIPQESDYKEWLESHYETKTLPAEMIAKLKSPLPPEAVDKHPTKQYLSTIKVIYIVERLNDVFGLGGWFVKNEIVENSDKMIIVKSTLTVPDYGIWVEHYGGNDNPDRGDAYKGACTDALSKIASYLYVGMDVYKGLVKPENKSQTTGASDAQKKLIRELMMQKNITLEDMATDGITKATPIKEVIEYLMHAKGRIN